MSSGKASLVQGGRHGTSRVPADRLTASEKAVSVDRGKQARSRNLSTVSDVASRQAVKMPQGAVATTSKASSKPRADGTGGRRSRSAAKVIVEETVFTQSPVLAVADLQETSGSQTDRSQRPLTKDNTRPEELNPDENNGVGNVSMDKANILSDVVEPEDVFEPEMEKSFRTPGRSRRARSIATTPGITFASVRKTPKNLRNSLLLRRMSPEEGYVVYF